MPLTLRNQILSRRAHYQCAPLINRIRSTILAALILVWFSFPAAADDVRVGDLVTVSGARDNQLNGFGLVVGLAGDGDKDPVYTQQTIANMLQRYGVRVQSILTQISAKNVAVGYCHGRHSRIRQAWLAH